MSLQVSTTDRVELLEVTDRIAEAVPDALENGLCTVFVPHTTAGLTINEAEPGLLADIEGLLSRLVPVDDGYDHDRIDDNADAHLRSALLGNSIAVPIENGRLELGTWQSILLVECDGPQTRRLSVTVTPGYAEGG